MAVFAFAQANQARSRELATNARDQLEVDPELSLLLAREAFAASPTYGAESVLRQATLDSQVRVTLSGHEGPVLGVAFSADGRRVASAGGEDGTVWDVGGVGDPVVLRGHQGSGWGVAFSADGRRVASAGEDGTVRIWQCEVCGTIEEVLELAEECSTRELTCQEREIYLHEPACPQ